MALIGQYKKKIKSAKSIAKITKAMQLVSASKMKKAQNAAIAGKDYAHGIHSLSNLIAKYFDEKTHKLAIKKGSGKALIVIVAPEKGLCGALVTNLSRHLIKVAKEEKNYEFIVIGKKAKQIARLFDGLIIADFETGIASPNYDMVPPIARLIEDRFVKGLNNKVRIVYSDFVNTMEQKPYDKYLLPLTLSDDAVKVDMDAEGHNIKEYVFEPSAPEVANPLLEMYLEVEIYQILLDSYASEQSARMVAMKNATDNAKSMIDGLTVEFNKVRQSAITNELLDIQVGSTVFT